MVAALRTPILCSRKQANPMTGEEDAGRLAGHEPKPRSGRIGAIRAGLQRRELVPVPRSSLRVEGSTGTLATDFDGFRSLRPESGTDGIAEMPRRSRRGIRCRLVLPEVSASAARPETSRLEGQAGSTRLMCSVSGGFGVETGRSVLDGGQRCTGSSPGACCPQLRSK